MLLLEHRLPRSRAEAMRNRRTWLLVLWGLLTGGVGLAVGLVLERTRVRPVIWCGTAVGFGIVFSLIRANWFPSYLDGLIMLVHGAWPGDGMMTLGRGWVEGALCTAGIAPFYRRWVAPPWERRDPLPAPVVDDRGVRLGTDDKGKTAVLTDAEVQTHALVLGATGTGKTNALQLIMASVLRRGQPLVVIDGKGSPHLAEGMERVACASGRVLSIFSFHGGCRYDPLRHGGRTELRDKLIGIETWTEPHYRRAAERYLGVVLDVLADLGERPTLPRLADLLLPPNLEALGRRLPKTVADTLYAYIDSLDRSSLSAITGLANRIGTLVASEAGPLLGEGGIDLLEAIRSGQPVLFQLDSLRLPGLTAQFGALVLQDLRAIAGELLQEPNKDGVYLVIDEFNVFQGAQVLALLNRGREAGFHCIIATQDLADVEAAGGDVLVDQVLANTNIKLLLRQDVDRSALRVAASVGRYSTWRVSHRARDGVPTGDATFSMADEYVVSPDALKRLAPYEAFLVKKAPLLSVQHVRLDRAGS